MTPEEYIFQYERLCDVFPNKFENPTKMDTVFKFVQDLEIDWFRKLVDRIVMTPHGNIDIGEEVAGEKRTRKSIEFADDVNKALDVLHGRITPLGLKKVLDAYQVKTLWEAVEKSRRGELPEIVFTKDNKINIKKHIPPAVSKVFTGEWNLKDEV